MLKNRLKHFVIDGEAAVLNAEAPTLCIPASTTTYDILPLSGDNLRSLPCTCGNRTSHNAWCDGGTVSTPVKPGLN